MVGVSLEDIFMGKLEQVIDELDMKT